MHPAYSVIFFTTASGAGYGLLVLLAVLAPLGLVPQSTSFGLVGLGLALALVTAGLLSSTFHLGHPERAWRAMSQWRSSWLSREGVMAVATYIPAAVLGIGWVFLGRLDGVFGLAGGLAAVLALVTVYCTGMIYASLRTIRAWNRPIVAPIYLVLALASGSVLLNFLLVLFGAQRVWAIVLSLALLAVAAVMKLAYWKDLDGDPGRYTIGQATGLGKLGDVRVLEPPHSRPNFVMREMGFEVARKHADKLRRLALWLAFAMPVACLLMLFLVTTLTGWAVMLLAVVCAGVGLVVERWLFFAEAEHVAMLFYGRERA